MRFIIRSKNDLSILKDELSPSKDTIDNPKRLFSKYDPITMEAGLSIDGDVPEFFSIDKEGYIQELPHPGYVEHNGHTISLSYKAVKGKPAPQTAEDLIKEGKIILNTPFEYPSGGKIKVRSLDQVLKDKALSDAEDCEKYLSEIHLTIKQKIKEQYPIEDELKITKAYLGWMVKKEKNSDAQKKYDEMEAYVSQVKATFRKMKDYAKKRLKELSSTKITASSSKAEIQAYLDSKGISYKPNEPKTALLNKI